MSDEAKSANHLHARFVELSEHVSGYGSIVIPEKREDPWLHVWLSSWLGNAHAKLFYRLSDCLRVCQSPIEKMFFIALSHIAPVSSLPVERVFMVLNETDRADALQSPLLHKLIIEPQAKVGNYSIDFRVEYWNTTFPERPSDPKTLNLVPKPKTNTQIVYVECDGHEFHERTKDQALRDRKRDRDLQRLGFTIFRFTGHEIWKDPLEPAYEVLGFFLKNYNGR